MIRRSRLLVPAALSAALLLSACGGSGGTSDGTAGPAPLSQAAFYSAADESSASPTTAHLSGSAGIQGQRATFSGDLQGATDPKDVQFSMTMDVASMKLQLRLVDAKIYVNPGQAGGGKFFVIDANDTSNPLGKQFNQLFESFDPSAGIKATKSAVTSFEAGDETTTIDGVETRPYTITVDTAKLVKATGQEVPAEAAAKLPKTSTTVVWMAEDGHPRRVKSSLGTAFSLEMDFTKWGEDVSIEKPSASQISDEDPFAATA